AFQIQDDYLDAFGDPEKFGKAAGGDIKQNKKTFLLIYALQTANANQKEELNFLLSNNADDKVERVLNIFKDCNVDDWAKELKQQYLNKALFHLEETAVLSARKKPLAELADFLIQREH
ncbi:MAG TPA: polyprenyl synthetase family protein, partial [Parafilimonas sp.]|nr:polyprenyl synthetase family protein [Parafilimonas sp.]